MTATRLMEQRCCSLFVALLCVACNGDADRRATPDPIPGIPAIQQRAVSRSEFDWRWPFTVGAGTVGCSSGAAVFRANGVDYALNDVARANGFSALDQIWLTQHSGPPSNPLKAMNQDQRMRVFARAAACDDGTRRSAAEALPCRQRLREAHQLTGDELKQIEVEGVERRWPPLPANLKDLGPLVEAALRLCQG
jgi:hypothetical protein